MINFLCKNKLSVLFSIILLLMLSMSFIQREEEVTIYLIGDSTMANYADNYDKDKDYMKTRYPMTGWGQVFPSILSVEDIKEIAVFKSDCVLVNNRARGGRSTRTFFQEGRWRYVYEKLQQDDVVIIQFGHNDAAVQKPERYVDVEGYKEFLSLFIRQSLEKGAVPIVLTPVARNYPWENGYLENVHGEYPAAAISVAKKFNVPFIDLNQLSIDAFSKNGEDYVSENYFMNLPKEKYEAYPDGLSDNTHFQPEGAKAVAQLVITALKELNY